jgi:phage/plasmid-like protein (TIGR03299 family)
MIDMSNNRANMAYVGQVPWHGLGRQLTEDAPLEIWCKEAGFDWDIKRLPIEARDAETGLVVRMPERHMLFRSDTLAPLSVMGENYKIVQPREVIEFYRSLVDTAGFKLETAGMLFGGRRFWALARTGDESTIMGQDRLKGYLLLASSCDGGLATTGMFTSVRVVCNNTLAASGAYSDKFAAGGGVRIPHSRVFNAEKVKTDLGLVHNAWAQFDENIRQLAQRKVTQGEAQQWLIETFGDPDKPVEEQDEAAARFMQKVWDAVRTAPGSNLRSADGTAWGLVNGATYYYDHVRRTRSDDARFDRAQWGDGATKKALAMKNALALVA